LARFLVTGAAGFIGRSIAAALLERGERVRGIDNFLTGRRENLIGLEAMEFLEGDLIDPETCRRACGGVEIIFHEAGLASVPRSMDDPVTIHRHCADATFSLLVAARSAGVRRVIYAGSSSVYGNASAMPLQEDMEANPISPYAAAKLAGEHYMRAFHRIYGLEGVVLRYFNVFGPYQDPASQYSGVLAIFSRKMLAGEQPTIYGDGGQSRDFTYIDNVVHANLLTAAAPAARVAGRVVNVGAGRCITLNDAFHSLSKLTGYRGKPAYALPRAGDIRDSLADICRAGELLGYAPHIDFEEGLRRTVAWGRTGLISAGQMAENFTRLPVAV
jgi:nucleoside-diphosphate-sugar epimerase